MRRADGGRARRRRTVGPRRFADGRRPGRFRAGRGRRAAPGHRGPPARPRRAGTRGSAPTGVRPTAGRRDTGGPMVRPRDRQRPNDDRGPSGPRPPRPVRPPTRQPGRGAAGLRMASVARPAGRPGPVAPARTARDPAAPRPIRAAAWAASGPPVPPPPRCPRRTSLGRARSSSPGVAGRGGLRRPAPRPSPARGPATAPGAREARPPRDEPAGPGRRGRGRHPDRARRVRRPPGDRARRRAAAGAPGRGILARAVERGEPPFVLVLDSLEDPQNVGTLLRSAEAAGVHGVIFPTHRQAPLTPAAVKASAGAVEHLLLAPVDDLPTALSDLRIHGLRVAAPRRTRRSPRTRPTCEGPLAIVVGSEGSGLAGGAASGRPLHPDPDARGDRLAERGGRRLDPALRRRRPARARRRRRRPRFRGSDGRAGHADGRHERDRDRRGRAACEAGPSESKPATAAARGRNATRRRRRATASEAGPFEGEGEAAREARRPLRAGSARPPVAVGDRRPRREADHDPGGALPGGPEADGGDDASRPPVRTLPRRRPDRTTPTALDPPDAGGRIIPRRRRVLLRYGPARRADVAQLVEQRFCKPPVPGSSPVVGSKCR